MSDLPRIYADFNNADVAGRLRLNVAGSLADLDRVRDLVEPGSRVIFYSEDLEVEGSVQHSESEGGIWVGRINWSHLRDANEPENE